MKFKIIIVLSFLLTLLGSTMGMASSKLEKATFAGGCFWCMEPPFEELRGVHSVISGYSGGEIKNPSYKQVSSGQTRHIESVQITFDPEKVSYSDLVKVFWKNIDPSDEKGQFVDKGHQYTTAIFYHSKDQKNLALRSKEFLIKKKYFKKIATDVREFKVFYPAEEYHQDFYKKSVITKVKYKYYRNASGRDDFIEKYWKGKSLDFDGVINFSKPSQSQLQKILTKEQYYVTQKEGTEAPFKNKYWNNKEEGIYVDIVSGEVLFSSKDKFKSGTGWPSFTKPILKTSIVEKEDNSLFSSRTEVRSKLGDSHLGHVFKDGPAPTGLRYCINSASLRFIPKSKLKEEGLSKYFDLFESKKYK